MGAAAQAFGMTLPPSVASLVQTAAGQDGTRGDTQAPANAAARAAAAASERQRETYMPWLMHRSLSSCVLLDRIGRSVQKTSPPSAATNGDADDSNGAGPLALCRLATLLYGRAHMAQTATTAEDEEDLQRATKMKKPIIDVANSTQLLDAWLRQQPPPPTVAPLMTPTGASGPPTAFESVTLRSFSETMMTNAASPTGLSDGSGNTSDVFGMSPIGRNNSDLGMSGIKLTTPTVPGAPPPAVVFPHSAQFSSYGTWDIDPSAAAAGAKELVPAGPGAAPSVMEIPPVPRSLIVSILFTGVSNVQPVTY